MVNLQRLAYAELVIAQVCVAINTVLAKQLVPVVPGFVLLSLRFMISALLLAAIMLAGRKSVLHPNHPTGRFQLKDAAYGLGLALSAGVLFNVFFIFGIERTSAMSAGIIASVLPAMVAVMSYFLLKERLTFNNQLAIFFAMAGIIVISMNNTHGSNEETGGFLGDFLVFIALIPEAFYVIMARFSKDRLSALGAALMANAFSAILLFPLAIAYWPQHGFSLLLDEGRPALMFLGGIAGVGFYFFWSHALQRVSANTAGIFGSVMPVATVFLAWMFLGEKLSFYDAAGLQLVIVAIYLGTGHSLRTLLSNFIGKRKAMSSTDTIVKD